MEQRTNGDVKAAIAALRDGKPVLVHDSEDREGETDLVYPAGSVTPDAVARMRNDAGGLICVALSDAVAQTLGLPFLGTALDHPSAGDEDVPYDDRSSFSLPVNHRETFTGITDADRSLTITALADVAAKVEANEDYGPEAFAADFRTPGHVHVLRGAPDLLSTREGHTELGLALVAAADLPPAVVVCEMLDDRTGGALPTEAARQYAARNDLVYVEGANVLDELR